MLVVLKFLNVVIWSQRQESIFICVFCFASMILFLSNIKNKQIYIHICLIQNEQQN